MPSSNSTRRPSARPSGPAGHSPAAFIGACLLVAAADAAAVGQVAAPAPAGGQAAAATEAPEAPSERLRLTTSDDVPFEAWYYPAAKPGDQGKDGPAPAVVILLHELGGSHKSVEPLARELQAAGIAVVAPDLRGHGAGAAAESKPLKAADFAKMAVTGGGRVRDQSSLRGDVETVRDWIKTQAEKGAFDMDKLVVVGSGVGAAVAATWTVADAAWPDIATGPQGGQVRGLVLVSPAWTTRGFSIAQALNNEPVRRRLPVLVIGGGEDADAVKIYDQLKKQRPDGWSEKRAGQAAVTQAAKLAGGTLPTLYLRQFDTALSGDRLAASVPKDRRAGGYPAAIIEAFIGAVTAADR